MRRRLALGASLVVLTGLLPIGCGEPVSGVDPDGAVHTFVASRLEVPTSPAEALSDGVGVPGAPATNANALGLAIAQLQTLAPTVRVSTGLASNLDRGSFILLLALQATSLAGAENVGAWTYWAKTDPAAAGGPSPAPCASAGDATCRAHLGGSAKFAVDGGAGDSGTFLGAITAGKFVGDAATLTLPSPLLYGVSVPVPLVLHRARLEIEGLTEIGFIGRIGGAVTVADVASVIVPAAADGVRAIVMAECDTTVGEPSCGCPSTSDAAALLGAYDTMPSDCAIADDEIQRVFDGLLIPDVDLDGDGTADAASLGLGIEGVGATFDVPAHD